jgi:hypothetical protein
MAVTGGRCGGADTSRPGLTEGGLPNTFRCKLVGKSIHASPRVTANGPRAPTRSASPAGLPDSRWPARERPSWPPTSSCSRSFRVSEGLSIAQIAERLGRAPATCKAYFYDPTGEKARAVKARYVGLCRGCGAYTQPRNGKGDAYAYCKACHPGAIQRRWTRERVLEGMGEWLDRYGWLPSSYDWSRTHAQRSGEDAARRLGRGSGRPRT